MRQRLPHGFLPAVVARFALGIIHLRCEAAAVRVRKDRLRVVEVGLHADNLHASFCMTRAFVVFSEKNGTKTSDEDIAKPNKRTFAAHFI